MQAGVQICSYACFVNEAQCLQKLLPFWINCSQFFIGIFVPYKLLYHLQISVVRCISSFVQFGQTILEIKKKKKKNADYCSPQAKAYIQNIF